MTAAIVGAAEYRARRFSEAPSATSLEQAADLALLALEDAGLGLADVDGISARGIYVTGQFVPATVAEYLGVRIGFGDAPDMGGATAAAMVWRAAAAIERGLAEVVVCLYPGNYPPAGTGDALGSFGSSSYLPGSPQAEFEIPFGHLGQNVPYAFIAQRYAHVHGYDPRALARMVVHQRINACANPDAIFHGQPLTEDEVLASPMIADPLHMLEIVRPVRGGAAIVVASADVARRTRHRPVLLTGFGEGIAHKSPQFARDLLDPPLREAAATAFAMAGRTPAEMQAAQIYDCYTIAVLMALEAAGFAARGEGLELLRTRDMTFAGDFPLNTNGGQLGFGQAGGAGGMTHVVEGYRQIAGRAGPSQIAGCDRVFVSGNGGIMSEQVALILEGRGMNGSPPLVSAIARPWWEALARDEIVMQRCDACAAWVFYPRPFCPACGSRSLHWAPVEHSATLYTWSVARVPVAPQFAFLGTPVLAVAEFGNGMRVPTSLVDVDPVDVRIGMALDPIFDRSTYPGTTMLRFRPASREDER